MNLDPAPRLNKLVFLAIDAGLLLAALGIVYFAKNPYAPLPFVSAVLCVVIAAVIGFVPFLTDFAADSADYVQEERRRVSDQVQRLQAATDSLARATAQIKALEESVAKSAHAAENLPYRMQEKLAEFNEALAAKDTDEREALERELDELRAANSDNLKSVADKIAKAAAEWSALEAASRKQLGSAQDATAALNDKLQATLVQLDSRIAALGSAAASTSSVAAVDARREEPAAQADGDHRPPLQAESPSVIESVTLSETSAAPATEESKPKKPRAPRKPKPEDTLAAMSAETAPAETASVASEPAVSPSEEPAAPADQSGEHLAKPEASISSDGATRLLVTAYIGIGNKLFIRGDGPGLSWDKGVPMQFVSIGKWGWASNDVTAPVACKLYKNDETAALSGEIFLEAGKHVELTALF